MKINKKYILIVMIMLLVAIFTGCQKGKAIPEETISLFFNSIKNGDIESCQSQLMTNEQISEKIFPNKDEKLKEIFEIAYKKLGYEIVETKIDKSGDNAEINVDIYAPDFVEIIAQSANEAYEFTKNNDSENGDIDKVNTSDKIMAEIMVDKINSEDMPMIKTLVTVDMIKKDESWKIEPNEDFFAAIAGGLSYIPEMFN
jgi:hypothetical protein